MAMPWTSAYLQKQLIFWLHSSSPELEHDDFLVGCQEIAKAKVPCDVCSWQNGAPSRFSAQRAKTHGTLVTNHESAGVTVIHIFPKCSCSNETHE
jgi:hypothetical protein